MESSQRRLQFLSSHFETQPTCFVNNTSAVTAAELRKKSPDDIVIVRAIRTPITKAKRGAFRDTPPEDLLAAVLRSVLQIPQPQKNQNQNSNTQTIQIDPSQVEDIVVGTTLPSSTGGSFARQALFFAGFPERTSVFTVDRKCSSGLQACASLAASLALPKSCATKNTAGGSVRIGIAAGVESMSWNYSNPFSSKFSSPSSPSTSSTSSSSTLTKPKKSRYLEGNEKAKECLLPMGLTSEEVASQFGVTRQRQDLFAERSHAKALLAQEKGLFSEIIPVSVRVFEEEKIGEEKKVVEKEVVVSKDDGPRKTSLPSLAKLPPAFVPKEKASELVGTTTAGNSSQISDGAAAVLMMRRETASELKLPVLGRWVSYAVVGVPPKVMGIGPAFAIPKVLESVGLTVEDITVFEINEAFASQAVYCVEKVGIPLEKVNPKGGAIALGHPLGCTGARQVATLLATLEEGQFGVVSMCIGTGMGAAAVLLKE